jgi:PAS domain S-box-containing protein
MLDTSEGTSLRAYLTVATVVSLGLLAIRAAFGYPLFHAVAEIFGVAIAAGAFMVMWNARRYISSGALIILGVGYLFAGGVDVLHALAYRGVNVFVDATTDLPTQLWLIGRYIQATAIIAAPFYTVRSVRPALVFWFYAALSAALLSLVFVFGTFPTAFVEGEGLTSFKIASEWILIVVMSIGLALLYRWRKNLDGDVFRSLMLSFALTIAAEFAFTLYTDPFGTANLVGHLLRIVSFILVYRAIIDSALNRPYGVMFRELAQTAEALNESERRFRFTFEQAGLGIAQVALDGSWLLVNQRLAEMTGYSIDELMKLTPAQITHPDYRKEEDVLIGRLVSGEADEYRLEKCYIRADGSTLWVNVSRTLVRDDSGAPRHFAAIVEDISVRKHAENTLRRSRDLNAALAVLDRAMNSTFDVNEILRRVLSEGGSTLGADSAAVVMREGTTWVARHTWRFPEDIIGQRFADTELPHAHEASRLGEPLAISDAFNDPRVNLDVMRRFGIRSVLTIPLTFRNRDLGTLYFNYHDKPHTFDAEEIDFTVKLSTALTLAIQNSRLYDVERKTVDLLQGSMLQIDDDIPGIELASAYYSATELTRIGGDFYDVFPLEGTRVAFVIGDVAGKGLEAAAVTHIARSTLRAFAYMHNGEPGLVATAVNRVMSHQIEEGRFITGIFGIIDTATGEVRLSCAGHPAPIVCGAASCSTDDIVRNPPFTVFPELDFQEHRTHLAVGESMVLFTDGLIDARSGSDFFGEPKVREILVKLGDAPPSIAVRVLLEAAQAHSGGTAPDDIAILAFRYLGTTTDQA